MLAAGSPARWRPLPAAGLHLTVAFLGEVPRARLPWLAAVVARHRDPAPPILLDRIETWGGGRWRCAVGDATPRLRAWQGRLAATLSAGGLRLERRAFVPHVTLARGSASNAGQAGPPPAPAPAGGVPLRPRVALSAGGLVLVESRPGRAHVHGPGNQVVSRYQVLLRAGRPGGRAPIGAKRALFRAGIGEDMY